MKFRFSSFVLGVILPFAGAGRGQTMLDLRTQTRNIDFSGATLTRPFQMGTTLPQTCVIGQAYFKTDASPGENLHVCSSPGVWSVQGRTGVASIAQGGTGATSAAGALSNLGAAPTGHGHAVSDLAGVSGARGNGTLLQMSVGGAAAGDCATFDATGNVVSTGAPCLASSDNYSQTFSNTLAVTLNHKLNTVHLVPQCFSGASAIEYDTLTIIDSNTVSISFATPQSGFCVVNGSSAGPGNGNVTNTGALTLDAPLFGNGGIAVKAGTRTGAGTEAVMSQSPVIVTPHIASFANAAHDHANATGGGNLSTASVAAAARHGNGSQFQLFAGASPAANDCAKFDASGNLASAGAPCGTAFGEPEGIQSGAGLTGDGTAAAPLAIDTSAVPTRITGAATLTFASLTQSTCSEQPLPLPGAATGDEVMIGAPADIDQGLLWSAYVSIANTVTVRLCKITGGTVSPVSRTWRATIVRSF